MPVLPHFHNPHNEGGVEDSFSQSSGRESEQIENLDNLAGKSVFKWLTATSFPRDPLPRSGTEASPPAAPCSNIQRHGAAQAQRLKQESVVSLSM